MCKMLYELQLPQKYGIHGKHFQGSLLQLQGMGGLKRCVLRILCFSSNYNFDCGCVQSQSTLGSPHHVSWHIII